jgi:hypothetical protein
LFRSYEEKVGKLFSLTISPGYEDLLEAEDEAYEARVLASLEDLKAGRIWRGTAEELIKQLSLED